MKWPLRNCGATYLRDVTGTVQTVQYSDSQCTLYTVTILAQASTLQLVACRALLYSTTTFYTVRVFYCNYLMDYFGWKVPIISGSGLGTWVRLARWLVSLGPEWNWRMAYITTSPNLRGSRNLGIWAGLTDDDVIPLVTSSAGLRGISGWWRSHSANQRRTLSSY